MGMSFQPAELMKLLLILMIGFMLARSEGETLRLGQGDRAHWPSRVSALLAGACAQPDLGNAIIYLVIMLGMLWIGNMKYYTSAYRATPLRYC